MIEWVQLAIQQWQSEKIPLHQGATIEQLQELESNIEFIFPDDFKELYLKVNGFIDWACSDNVISIWPVERIQQEYIETRDKNFIGFCDYLIYCHAIGFYKGKAGIFKSYDEFNPIAMDFSEAIRMINADEDSIY